MLTPVAPQSTTRPPAPAPIRPEIPVAAFAGVGRNTVYRLEAGESGTVEAILKLAAALDVPVGHISPEAAELIASALPKPAAAEIVEA